MTDRITRAGNGTCNKLAAHGLNDPDSYRDCASIKVCAWLIEKNFEIVFFGYLQTVQVT